MLIGITGGSGFVGRALVTRHLAEGETVRLLTRQPGSEGFSGKVEMVQADLTGPLAPLERFSEGLDVLYHCAAELRDPSRMSAVNVVGTENLGKAAAHRIGHWVQLSSVGVYGPRTTGVVTEEQPVNPVNIYERSKYEAEQMVIACASRGDFSCSILRPANIFGPGMASQGLLRMFALINRGFFVFIGRPGVLANYIHLDNVIEALMRCGRLPAARGRIYNLSDEMILEAFVTLIAKMLRKEVRRLRLPEAPVRWLAGLVGSIPGCPLSMPVVNGLTNRSRYSNERIRDELGYRPPVAMEDGLRQLVDCWQRQVMAGHCH